MAACPVRAEDPDPAKHLALRLLASALVFLLLAVGLFRLRDAPPAPQSAAEEQAFSRVARLQTSANGNGEGTYSVPVAHLLGPGRTELRFRIEGQPSQRDAEHVWGGSDAADPTKRPVLIADGRRYPVQDGEGGGMLSSAKGFSLFVDLDGQPRSAEIVLQEAGAERGSLTLLIEARPS